MATQFSRFKLSQVFCCCKMFCVLCIGMCAGRLLLLSILSPLECLCSYVVYSSNRFDCFFYVVLKLLESNHRTWPYRSYRVVNIEKVHSLIPPFIPISPFIKSAPIFQSVSFPRRTSPNELFGTWVFMFKIKMYCHKHHLGQFTLK